jgi:uroporphyrinogen decarboxylase
MNSRERVTAALGRKKTDRAPMNMWLTPHLVARLKNERGAEDFQDCLKMDLRFSEYHAVLEKNDFSKRTRDFHPGASVDAWGCGSYPVGYYHYAKSEHPLKGLDSAEEIDDYPFPALRPELGKMREGADAIKNSGFAACSQYECGTFERATALVGMEELLMLMHARPELAERLFHRISDIKARVAAAHTEAGVDILWIGDDIGIQRGPLMSPVMWRELVLPHLKKIIRAARKIRDDIPVAYHSCGSVAFAMDGLVGAGIDIIQSVQPEANNIEELYKNYGSKLCFWGGIGSQSVMSHGGPDDVRKETRCLLDLFGPAGGYICAPAHCLGPETPLENIDAFVDEVLRGY